MIPNYPLTDSGTLQLRTIGVISGITIEVMIFSILVTLFVGVLLYRRIRGERPCNCNDTMVARAELYSIAVLYDIAVFNSNTVNVN